MFWVPGMILNGFYDIWQRIMSPTTKKERQISKSLLCFVPDFRSNFDIFMLFLITNIDNIQPGWNKGLSRLKCPRVPFSLLAWLVNSINSIIKSNFDISLKVLLFAVVVIVVFLGFYFRYQKK